MSRPHKCRLQVDVEINDLDAKYTGNDGKVFVALANNNVAYHVVDGKSYDKELGLNYGFGRNGLWIEHTKDKDTTETKLIKKLTSELEEANKQVGVLKEQVKALKKSEGTVSKFGKKFGFGKKKPEPKPERKWTDVKSKYPEEIEEWISISVDEAGKDNEGLKYLNEGLEGEGHEGNMTKSDWELALKHLEL